VFPNQINSVNGFLHRHCDRAAAALVLMLPVAASAQKDTAKQKKDQERYRHKKKIADSIIKEAVFDTVKTEFDQDSIRLETDSAVGKLFTVLKDSRLEIEKRNVAEYRDDTIATKQDAIIEELKRLTLEAEGLLNNGLDTNGLNNELFQD
jgi:hypothetical protein